MRLLRALFAPIKGPQVGEMTIKYSNLPERYIKRAMRQIEFENPKGKPQYMPRTLERRVFK
jgi:large subunit ribosomal protein L24